ncbi:response regulator [Oharaeibacter diazotrophicus]|uniref:Two-component system phosphate regulon response regulator OmpR n=1 Tax=Oharaeibacter diazotrophicus TaxID=1920512 RepID=A0A4R6R992_9HYPH|nr:response regulator transcription factor [Oharaeibacter diazotrophicus]TDP82630.1 two-component system phosphate regulon response regulator OmpR [Oharaeibacter diazotrophicus]BBE72606.1 transcriptional regulatory protein OmpR [Pleomorphomonas sp. SM30]GLS76640.1 DNA-binding response regulator [Oharaeibacter diazotrophicus]
MAPRPPSDDAGHVLVVDDDSRIRQLIGRYLGNNGFRVTGAGDAAEARRKLAAIDFDLMVLDVMMPGEDGLSLTASLKRERDVPILLLTARGDPDDRIRGLEAGADDYLAKPFEPRELLLRLANLMKRRPAEAKATPPETVRFGRFAYDLRREELRDGDEVVRLTDRERQLLGQFAAAPDGIVGRDQLAGPDADVGDRAVDVQINRLRRKIEDDPANPVHLQTVRGVGYRLRWE